MIQRRALLHFSLAGTGLLGILLFTGWWQVDGPGRSKQINHRPISISEMDFELTDHDGQLVGPGSLLGWPSMVFFGFTYCPDICPTTLSNISGWLRALEQDADQLNVVFITVDPARDTVEALGKYVRMFHPSIRGWTGSTDQIRRVTEAFRTTYERISIKGGGYTMQHTASVFLFDASGNFVSTIDIHEPTEYALPKIRRAIKSLQRGDQ